MTFSEHMSVLSFTTPLLCSLVAGWKADRSFGFLIGLVVGLLLSGVSLWGARSLFRWVARHPKLGETHPGALWLSVSWFLCVVLAVWIFGLSFACMWLTKFFIHVEAIQASA